MKRVLLCVHTNTYFIELQRVARLLKESGRYSPLMWFARDYPTAGKDIEQCLAEDIPCLAEDGTGIVRAPASHASTIAVSQAHRKGASWPRRGWRWLRRLGGRLLSWRTRPAPVPDLATATRSVLDYFRARLAFVRDALSRERPALLVMAGDHVGYDSSVFVRVARDLGIPTVIVPSTMTNALEVAEYHFHDPNFHCDQPDNRLVGRFYPRWVYEHRGRKLLRVPAARALAMEILGLAPPNPWMVNSGYADVVAVESEAMRQYYLDGGLPEHQLIVVGSLADDVMAGNLGRAESLRGELLRRLHLSPDRPIVLSALPPDQLYGYGRPECDFKSYADLVAFWIETVAQLKDCNVLITVHPSVNSGDFKHLERTNVKIAAESTAALIPLCQIFVASVSSVIRWAIACGKPVVNFDVYRYRYTDYTGVAGVLTMEEKEDFSAALARLATDGQFFDEVSRQQRAAAARWGRLDGRAGERMLQLFDRLSLSGHQHKEAA